MAQNNIERSIEQIYELIENCKQAAFSNGKVIVPKDELYDLLEELKIRTPEEIKRYQKIIANRDSIIAQAEEKAGQIIEEAKAKAKQLVSEHEIMQQAFSKANEVVSSAGAEAEAMLSSATADAEQIRSGALNYANDIMTDMEKILQEAYETTRTRSEALVSILQENLQIVTYNHQELEQQIHPETAAIAFDEPIMNATADDYEFAEDTFLEGVEEA